MARREVSLSNSLIQVASEYSSTMGVGFGIKNPNWDLNKGAYPEVDEYPLMATLGPVVMIIAIYLLFILKVGPAFMRKREAYKLKKTLLIYNAIQVAASVYLVGRFTSDLLHMGLVPKTCHMDQEGTRKQVIMGIWLYFAAKVSELLDTVFFVLRKKTSQISFLHLYHHTVMVIGTWAMLKYSPSHTLIFIGFLNSLVHVFMYTYYGLAALGPNIAKYLTWKKYMTSFQLIQFVLIIMQYFSAVKTSDCPPSKGIAGFIISNTFVFILLFSNFYKKNYNAEYKKTEKCQ
ncbi:elongation of very long chain fatty acids protein-like isoform X2 [Galleria mellonella]|uniref:Elongation of very long chain fatty acids protein n=1 Tax=Galleria mellonella TaxID=7137 RepID=A0ABM3MLH9_GALME|nr:elongation of very long chain fatty acids protein-like isoform X2 [Galleria mellonella]